MSRRNDVTINYIARRNLLKKLRKLLIQVDVSNCSRRLHFAVASISQRITEILSDGFDRYGPFRRSGQQRRLLMEEQALHLRAPRRICRPRHLQSKTLKKAVPARTCRSAVQARLRHHSGKPDAVVLRADADRHFDRHQGELAGANPVSSISLRIPEPALQDLQISLDAYGFG